MPEKLESPWLEALVASVGPLDRFFGSTPRDEIIKWSVAQQSTFVTHAICMYLGARDIVEGVKLSPVKLQQEGYVVSSPDRLPGFIGCGYLETLRFEGWSVAVHNDYWIKPSTKEACAIACGEGKVSQDIRGEFYTFWLLTHPNGTFVKGEGKTDHEALKQAYDMAAPVGGR